MKLLEKVKNTKNKKKVIAAIIAMAIVLTAGTIALLSQVTQAANNNFAGQAGVNVGVYEEGGADSTGSVYEDSTGTGNTREYSSNVADGVYKTVKILNKNYTTSETNRDYPTSNTYVRARIVACFRYNDTVTDTNGSTTACEYAGQVYAQTVEKTQLVFEGKDSNWILANNNTTGSEDYYYYNTAVAPGEMTNALFTHVQYTGTVPENTHLEVQVLTEGIAAGSQTSYTAAWNAATGTSLDYTVASNN